MHHGVFFLTTLGLLKLSIQNCNVYSEDKECGGDFPSFSSAEIAYSYNVSNVYNLIILEA